MNLDHNYLNHPIKVITLHYTIHESSLYTAHFPHPVKLQSKMYDCSCSHIVLQVLLAKIKTVSHIFTAM